MNRTDLPPPAFDPAAAHEPAWLLARLLDDQRNWSAADRFATWHDHSPATDTLNRYGTLLTASPPAPGEQYAFEVDLDACSGCKSCVTACHSLNGLDECETFRDVGLLHGGSPDRPFTQHVTTACHHCLEPACMHGCPVRAYEKDPVTGIIRHLDDQCIGCQYCMLACPYDVPKYNDRLGIVRKCDMCSGRLAVGEPPACAQACPNGAIRITVVRQQQVVEDSEAAGFLPGAPDPSITLPTTQYRSRRAAPRNTLPADYYAVRPGHAHGPLVFMLVLTQLSVGSFLVAWLLSRLGSTRLFGAVAHVHAAGALAFGLVAIAASVFHLGRPRYAFRAVLGLGTSWLSREILAFSVFAVLATVYAVATWRAGSFDDSMLEFSLGGSVVAAGLGGVACSIMIYHRTARSVWHAGATAVRFLFSTVLLGIATTLFVSVAGAFWNVGPPGVPQVMADHGTLLVDGLALVAAIKLSYEISQFRHLRSKQHTPARRRAMLLVGELARVTVARFLLGCAGGFAPLVLCLVPDTRAAAVAASGLAFACSIAGELLERYLFFTAAAAPRMPGRLVH